MRGGVNQEQGNVTVHGRSRPGVCLCQRWPQEKLFVMNAVCILLLYYNSLNILNSYIYFFIVLKRIYKYMFTVTWTCMSKPGDIYKAAPCDLSILTFCICTILSQKKWQAECACVCTSCARAFVTATASVWSGGSCSHVCSSALLPSVVTQKATVLTEACLSFRSAFAQGSWLQVYQSGVGSDP